MTCCTECSRPLSPSTKGSLCARHYNKARLVAKHELDVRIEEALRENPSRNQVATMLGISRYRVSEVATTMSVSVPAVRMADIIRSAAAHSGLTVSDVKGKARFRHIVFARQAVCLAGVKMGHSVSSLGRALDRDHTTVMHSRDMAEARCRTDPGYAEFVATIAAGIMPEIGGEVEAEEVEDEIEVEVTPPAKALGPICHDIVARVETRMATQPRASGRRSILPKNDFAAGDAGEDESHKFHQGIAKGSANLLAALRQAMAA